MTKLPDHFVQHVMDTMQREGCTCVPDIEILDGKNAVLDAEGGEKPILGRLHIDVSHKLSCRLQEEKTYTYVVENRRVERA